MDAALLAFGVVFVAEFGDKTQLIALGLAARYSAAVVLTGVVAANFVTQGVAALVGGVAGAALPTTALRLVAAALFFAFAAWTLREALQSGPDEEDEGVELAALDRGVRRGSLGLVAGIVGALVFAEVGDKSMFATATIAADRGALGAWLGAALGMSASGGIAVVVGSVLGARIPERTTAFAAAGLFTVFGVLLLVDALV